MVWFRGFLRSQPVKAEFAISQAQHAISHPGASLQGYLLEMAFLSSCTWREWCVSALSPSETQVKGCFRLSPGRGDSLCCPLVCSLCPSYFLAPDNI